MERVRDRLGDLLEKLQSEGLTLSQDELLKCKSELMSEYMSIKDICSHKDINDIQQILLYVDKLLNID